MYGSRVEKSAGGSLKAMCAFSPIPMKPTSTDSRRISRESAAMFASTFPSHGTK